MLAKGGGERSERGGGLDCVSSSFFFSHVTFFSSLHLSHAEFSLKWLPRALTVLNL